jgi:hypothetical protein
MTLIWIAAFYLIVEGGAELDIGRRQDNRAMLINGILDLAMGLTLALAH